MKVTQTRMHAQPHSDMEKREKRASGPLRVHASSRLSLSCSCCSCGVDHGFEHLKQVDARRTRLQEAKAQAPDRRRNFGYHATRLHDVMQQQFRRFHQQPIGPLGYYLTITDYRYVTRALNCHSPSVGLQQTCSLLKRL